MCVCKLLCVFACMYAHFAITHSYMYMLLLGCDSCTVWVTVSFLGQRLHIDVGEDDVVQDVDSVDAVELSDAVSELEQRDVVHSHPERLLIAQDLHLEQRKTGSIKGQTRHTVCIMRMIYDDEANSRKANVFTEKFTQWTWLLLPPLNRLFSSSC